VAAGAGVVGGWLGAMLGPSEQGKKLRRRRRRAGGGVRRANDRPKTPAGTL